MARAKKKTAETEGPVEPTTEGYVPRLQEIYKSAVAPELQKRFKYKSSMQVPRLVKVTLNVGLGEATQNPKLLDAAAEEIARMTGQKPIIQKAKKAIANFRLRENQRIGVTVTLRRARMWEFLDRLVNVALPRVRLPGHLAASLRRSRQLHAGPARADHLSGSGLRQGREDQGTERDDRDDG